LGLGLQGQCSGCNQAACGQEVEFHDVSGF
jgi:hypothetical protein